MKYQKVIALQINKICLAALFLCLGWILPLATGNNMELGNTLSLMHLPILLCGFVIGPVYGALIGFITPITRSFIFGGPLFPSVAVPMAFELMTYGLISGIFFIFFVKRFKKIDSLLWIYVSLVIAMILGRLVGGFTKFLITIGNPESEFTFMMFLSSYFVVNLSASGIQLVVIPLIIRLLYQINFIQKFMPNYNFRKRKFEEVEVTTTQEVEDNNNQDNGNN